MSVGSVGQNNFDRYSRWDTEEATPDVSDAGSSADILLIEGDLGAQMAALVIRTGQSQREADREIRLAEESALEREEAAQIATMHEKADDIRAAGTLEGAGMMAKGGCQLGGSFAQSPDTQQRWTAGASISEGGGRWLSGLARGAEADDDARAKQHDYAAGHHRRALEDTRDGMRDSQKLVEHAVDFYRDHQRGEGEAERLSVQRG